MKKNVNSKLALAAAVVLLLNFSSCGKYEEGPGFSLRSKTNRLAQEWKVTDIDVDDDESFAAYVDELDIDVTAEFEKEGDFTMHFEGEMTMYGYNIEIDEDADGEWEWKDGKEAIEVTFDDEYYEDLDGDFTILRLTKKELKFEDEDGNIWECEAAE